MHLKLSAEMGTAGSLGFTSEIASWCVPDYYGSESCPLTAARWLSKRCSNITYTQVCRGFRTLEAAMKVLAAAAAIREIRTVLAVTGDNASPSDISVFDLIMAIDRKRFRPAAALVFTRKNEARRIAEKSEAGASAFYTQPVFKGGMGSLLGVLKRLSGVNCSVRLGVLVPFQAAVCKRIAEEKPDFITDTAFIRGLAAAEEKGAAAAYEAAVGLAAENVEAAIKIAAKVNSGEKSCCKVSGIHLYGLGSRVFGSGKGAVKVAAAQLLEAILAGKKQMFK